MKLGTQTPIYIPEGPIALPKETATIVNISETPFNAERTYGTYVIRACQKGEPYVTLVVSAARAIIDMGDRVMGKLKGTKQEPIKAMDIAEDLVRQWNSDIWGLGSTPTGEVQNETVRGFAGVFVADGVLPTAEELAMAHQIFELSDRALAECAHREWDQFHRPDMIHAGWKRAARRLGVDAEWLYAIPVGLPDCPHCGSKMKTATATVCSVCHRDVVAPAVARSEAAKGKGTRKRRAPAESARNANEAA